MAAQDLPCAMCGKMMWRSSTSLPDGKATCLPCRRQRMESTRRTPSPEQRFCRICDRPFATAIATQVYCSAECRNSRRNFTTKVATAAERGYGAAHQRARREWKLAVDAQGGISCCLCGEWVDATETWHLDHTPDRSGYRGVAHASCNVRDGASRGATSTNLTRSYDKACTACGGAFTTAYPKQAYCSRECRPKRKPRASQPKPKKLINCMDCGAAIKQGKRCSTCAKNHWRDYMRNRYRTRVGIPLDVPKHDRSWRAA